jgi:hypothetical protein
MSKSVNFPQTTLAAHSHLAHALCGPQQVGQLLDGQALLGVFALALAAGDALEEIGLGNDVLFLPFGRVSCHHMEWVILATHIPG